jgi:hypothetical protein
MKAWSAALETEIGGWPRVQSHSFFGFTALYRGDRIFALLPRTRGMETANALAFKLESPGPQTLARLGLILASDQARCKNTLVYL